MPSLGSADAKVPRVRDKIQDILDRFLCRALWVASATGGSLALCPPERGHSFRHVFNYYDTIKNYHDCPNA